MASAIEAAQRAAAEAFDAWLSDNHAGAAMSVPPGVILAAQKAYALAGGRKAIVVFGRGNPTHRVCSVGVKIDSSKQARLDLAEALEAEARALRTD